MRAVIDVSAEFGGGPADELLPHFWGLKAECRNVSLPEFPFPELAFILRVDGSISSFGLSGPGFVSVDRRGRWVSVDIGIPSAEHARGDRHVAAFVAAALPAAVDVLQAARRKALAKVDWVTVREVLRGLGLAYQARMLRDGGGASS